MDRTDKEEYFFGSVLLLANKLQIWGDNIVDDITFKQFFLLLFIPLMNNASPTVKEIADFTGTTRQNVKKMLEHLETEGYISMSPSQTDARALSVGLTSKTFEYFNTYEKKAAQAVNELFSDVSDNELQIATRTTDKLLSALGLIKNEKT